MDLETNPAWKDLSPIFNSEVEDSVVGINYSIAFKTIFAYLRALLKTDERSERAFELTTEAAEANPANYTVWQYRRNLLKSLNKDLKTELKYTTSIIFDNPKNYQVWHHRKVLIEWLNDPSGELEFTESVLAEDSKNYHAWQHRHWVVQKFKVWAEELEYSGRLLEEDIRNNSAWNYRYFVITSTTGFTPEVSEGEIKTALAAIRRAPQNESSWNYLSGVMIHKNAAGLKDTVQEFCESLYEKEKCRSSHLLSFMADQALALFEAGEGDSEKQKAKATSLLEELIEVDPIRRHYWESLKPQ